MKNNNQTIQDQYKQDIIFKQIYKNSFEFEGRIKKTFFNDTIYMGIFEKTLIQELGFTKKFLKNAQKKRILYKKHFAPNGIKKTYRTGYLLLSTKLPQRTRFKRSIKKFGNYLKLKDN